ncbi:MAG: triose-phosphate isomerase [Candidatus Omnitrophota bacterium]|nr:triose-phosphate isomerase [Candidatus Omnitrophota bacterium]MBU2529395.1 triose-phosphate isomerase [bacterium]MBU3929961.1 triose-phosphate isomerase [bacterium]MBU4122685.1 triose-phosphate isomerase [bacterium]
MRKIIIAGNWKMNMSNEEAVKLSRAVASGLGDLSSRGRIAVMCPPFTALNSVAPSISGAKGLYLGAQNMFYEDNGAYTGEVSADMLLSCGCSFCIIGHSERRKYFGETDETVNKKAKKALEKSLTPVICVGETLEERESSRAFNVVKKQITGALQGISKEDIAKVVIAYEPVWAIGTGKTASPEQAQSMHAYIREQIAGLSDGVVAQSVSILYGGSMNPSNVKGLLECTDIDGGLIGGASLKAEDFLKLVHFDD